MQEFMSGLREFCDENGMLLLIDEVQTGWCRTGKVMSYMNYGIKPDIVSMAKALGGGMPIGAICTTEDVSKHFLGFLVLMEQPLVDIQFNSEASSRGK